MKKISAFILSFLFLAMPLSAKAAPAPLARVSTAAAISDEGEVQLVSYKANVKIDSETAETNASIVLKNASSEEDMKIMAGMPSHINQGNIKINNLQVIMEGTRYRLSTRRDRTQQEDAGEMDLPPNWLTWTVDLKPGEYKVIDISYTTNIQKAENGTMDIYIPLDFLKLWHGTPQIVEVTVDVGSGLPYMFEPNPSDLPHEYDKKARLTWTYENSYPSGDIQLFYRPLDQLAAEYITAQSQGQRSITSIVRSFQNKSYNQVIEQIDEYMESQEDDVLTNELLFMKALAHQELLQTAEAVEIFDRVEGQPMFGELEGTFKNKIIFDKYMHMKSLMTDEAALHEYLNSSKNYIMGNAIFMMWVEEELNQLSQLIPVPEDEPDPSEAEPVPEEPSDEDEKKNELVRSVTIGRYELSVEVLFLGILAIVIIITTIISRRRKRRRSRYYYFR